MFRCLLLDIDPVGLSRGRREGPSLQPYINDRPYVASSFLSVALADHFAAAMGGRSKERQALADQALPFEVTIATLPARGGEPLIRKLFEPLGYVVTTIPHRLAEAFADWTEAPYFTVTLAGTVRLRDLLAHMYVLIPVLDDQNITGSAPRRSRSSSAEARVGCRHTRSVSSSRTATLPARRA